MNNDIKKEGNPKPASGTSATFIILALAFGVVLGVFWRDLSDIKPANRAFSLPPDRKEDIGRSLINPLIDCEFAKNSFIELQSFNREVEIFVENLNNRSDKTDFVALYFRDLNNGPWVGINEKDNFSPASLLKVPIMIAYFKEAETNPSVLQKIFMFADNGKIPLVEQTILPEKPLEIGKFYTVEELIRRMIVYSDNLAQHLLVANINLPVLMEVFNDFGLKMPDQEYQQIEVNVQGYSRFFRVLFNASYLNNQYSELALELLSQSEFKDGLAAGVPQNIIIAHKFGERQFLGKSDKQFHDCGIVYYPQHPYLICVMSRGKDSTELINVIRDISAFVYDKFNSQFKK